MRVIHPYALDDDAPEPDGTVHWGGRRRLSEVDEDGTFHVPDDGGHNLDDWAAGYGYELEDLVVEAEADELEPDQEAESGASADASDDTADGSESDDEAEEQPHGYPHNDDGEPLCVGTTGSGDPCSRVVDEPGGYCYQHGPED